MSAPLSPAARTRTSSSPASGLGSGCSSTDIRPSRIVAARIARSLHSLRRMSRVANFRACLRLNGRSVLRSFAIPANEWPFTKGYLPFVGVPHISLAGLPKPALPQLPALPPLWRESRFALELAGLRRSDIYRGAGLLAGEGRPVMLIPGFLA